MHFPSVVHLAPRRNDLFGVYSRSLTLIKITVSRLAPPLLPLYFLLFFPSRPFFLSFFRFFFCSFLVSPSVSFQRTPAGDGSNYRQEPRKIFAFYPVTSAGGVQPKVILALISLAHLPRTFPPERGN